ncbi:hypothetical protein Tco_1384537 [Tanacetum coccineum]
MKNNGASTSKRNTNYNGASTSSKKGFGNSDDINIVSLRNSFAGLNKHDKSDSDVDDVYDETTQFMASSHPKDTSVESTKGVSGSKSLYVLVNKGLEARPTSLVSTWYQEPSCNNIEWFRFFGYVGYISLCIRLVCLVLPRSASDIVWVCLVCLDGSVCLNLNLLSKSAVLSAVCLLSESAALSAATSLLNLYLSVALRLPPFESLCCFPSNFGVLLSNSQCSIASLRGDYERCKESHDEDPCDDYDYEACDLTTYQMAFCDA